MDPDNETLARELARGLTAFLAEATAEKQEARQRAAERHSQGISGRFLDWWGKHGTSIAGIIAAVSIVVGGLWSVAQYVDQQQKQTEQRAREAEIERRRVLGDLALDLSRPEVRNGAAYAVAVLAGKEAIPLLTQHLVDSAEDKNAVTFRRALVQAFITIGEPSLPSLIQLNQQAVASRTLNPRPPMVLATQPVILHFLRNRAPYFLNDRERLRGVLFIDANLSYQNLDGVGFKESQFWSSNFCQATLRSADLSHTVFIDRTQFGGAKLQAAQLEGADFWRGANFSGADMAKVHGRAVRLVEADLERANLADADLSGGDLSQAILRQTKLTRVNLRGADLTAADLEGADLSQADLTAARLFSPGGKPLVLVPRNERDWAGANVLGADFNGAKIDGDARPYLCHFGARNVPGGCEGIAPVAIPKREASGFSTTSCF